MKIIDILRPTSSKILTTIILFISFASFQSICQPGTVKAGLGKSGPIYTCGILSKDLYHKGKWVWETGTSLDTIFELITFYSLSIFLTTLVLKKKSS